MALATDYTGAQWDLWQGDQASLTKAENDYSAKYGEGWRGPKRVWSILTPGIWQFEFLGTALADIYPNITDKTRPWGSARCQNDVYSPAGQKTTDLWIVNGAVTHFDMADRKFTTALGSSGAQVGGTVDRVTGRYYYRSSGDGNIYYIEKLYPFTHQGQQKYLPAFLRDYSALGLPVTPVPNAEPVFTRTKTPIAGAHTPMLRGRRALLGPDGSLVYLNSDGDGRILAVSDGKNEYQNIRLPLRRATLDGAVAPMTLTNQPANIVETGTNAAGSHGASYVGIDGWTYIVEHPGSLGGPGRMYRISPSGQCEMIYNNLGNYIEAANSIDGPVDAKECRYLSTMHGTQNPRDGGVTSGGWDFSGVRHTLDGFTTSMWCGHFQAMGDARDNWTGFPDTRHMNNSPAIAFDGTHLLADDTKYRTLRVYRTNWPAKIPPYWFGEKVLPRATLEQKMLAYAQNYIANYQPPTTLQVTRYATDKTPGGGGGITAPGQPTIVSRQWL